jgi:hypothetical protein
MWLSYRCFTGRGRECVPLFGDFGDGVYERIDPYWVDFEMMLVPQVRRWRWRMWADHGVEFFIHPAMRANPTSGFRNFSVRIEKVCPGA